VRPGKTLRTRIPSRFTFSRRLSARALSPCLVAAYCPTLVGSQEVHPVVQVKLVGGRLRDGAYPDDGRAVNEDVHPARVPPQGRGEGTHLVGPTQVGGEGTSSHTGGERRRTDRIQRLGPAPDKREGRPPGP
jgi:hypothetical protein